MKILVNCHPMPLACEGAGGAGKYLQAIIPALAVRAEVMVVCSRRNRAEYEFDGVTTIVLDHLDGKGIEKYCRQADVYFNPVNGFSPTDLPGGIAVVSLVHDLQHNHYPTFFPNGSFEARNREYGFEISRSDGLVAISEWEKSNLEKYFDASNVGVVYHSSYLYDWYQQQEKEPEEFPPRFENYYLYPAVGWPHKNHYRLIEAFHMLNRSGATDCNLILTGLVDHVESTALWRKKFDQLDCGARVELKGHVSDQELAYLMSNCKGLIFPSLYEGFGIPLIDAMNFGRPVLASRLTCIPEVTHGAVEYFRNVCDSAAMARDIRTFDRQIDVGGYDIEHANAVAREYSTSRTVDDLLAFLEKVNADFGERKLRSAYSPKQVSVNRDVVKVTVILDFGGTQAEELCESKIRNSLRDLHESSAYELILLVPYDLEEIPEFEALRAEGLASSVAYFERSSYSSKILALEHTLQLDVRTEYFLYLNSSDGSRVDHACASRAVSYLEYFDDIYSCFPSDEFREVAVIRPPNEARAIKRFRKIVAGGASPEVLNHFSGRVIRAETCRHDGMIGTVASLSKDLTHYHSAAL